MLFVYNLPQLPLCSQASLQAIMLRWTTLISNYNLDILYNTLQLVMVLLGYRERWEVKCGGKIINIRVMTVVV